MLDLGVTRSDCTYDVVHVWRGRFYRLDAHLDRLSAGLARLRLDPGHDRTRLEDNLHGCVRQLPLDRGKRINGTAHVPCQRGGYGHAIEGIHHTAA